jgi:DNA-binding response OmpR family regulator
MSANSDNATKQCALDAGMDLFIAKPFVMVELQPMIENLLIRYLYKHTFSVSMINCIYKCIHIYAKGYIHINIVCQVVERKRLAGLVVKPQEGLTTVQGMYVCVYIHVNICMYTYI